MNLKPLPAAVLALALSGLLAVVACLLAVAVPAFAAGFIACRLGIFPLEKPEPPQ